MFKIGLVPKAILRWSSFSRKAWRLLMMSKIFELGSLKNPERLCCACHRVGIVSGWSGAYFYLFE